MPRCWRLDYANEFHLDITPSIPNPECRFGGELVPDKTLKTWKASNPKGYRAKFERRAALQPRIRALQKAFDSARADVQVEPYPDEMRLKGILRRTVQIAKRHRDLHFIDDSEGLVPLSIIITTLASRAYEFCVSNFEYDNELFSSSTSCAGCRTCWKPAYRGDAPHGSSGIRRRPARTSAKSGTGTQGAQRPSLRGTPRRSRTSPGWQRRTDWTRFGTALATSSAPRPPTRRWIP
jgi:hypothetical protein